MNRRVLVAALSFFAACKGKPAEEAAKASPTPAPAAVGSNATAAGSSSGSGSGSGAAAPKAGKRAPKPPAPEDPKARAAYRDGMRKGRKATDAKQWAEAIAGFDAALAAKKGDPRALGERGFARLLEGSDLAAASRDLDQAATGTKDPKLLSQIWFNRGLIEEKRGLRPNALAAFVIANGLRPTAAAQQMIAGGSPCPVSIERGPSKNVFDHPPVDAADWLALARALPHEDDATLATTEDAWELLTSERQDPGAPSVIYADDSAEKVAYLVVKTAAGLHATPLGARSGGRCPGTVGFRLGDTTGRYLVVAGEEQYDGGYTFMCESKTEQLVECTGAANEVSAGTACLGGSATHRDLVIDPATGAVVMSLSQPDGDKLVAVTLDPKGVKLAGAGCDRVEPVK